MAIPRYAPRHFRSPDTWRFSEWLIKVYVIAAEAEHFLAMSELMEASRVFVAANLDRMNVTPHYSVGFAILHHGSAAKSLLTHWWTNECVCLHYVGQSEFAGPPQFKQAKQDLMRVPMN